MRASHPIFCLMAVFALSGGVGAAAAAHEVSNKGVTVAHPWARATPGGATVGAAFMEIRADAGVTDRLISAASPAAARVEVHTHIMDGDVMKMRRVDNLELKPGASRILNSMGDHVMLFDLKQPLIEGDLVKIQLTFEKAGMLEIEGSVEPAGAMGPHGMSSQPLESGAAGSSVEKSGHEHQHMDHN